MKVEIPIEVDAEKDMAEGLCSFCRRKITRATGFIEFYSLYAGRLCHPSASFQSVAFFTHAQCGPDTGYALAFDRLHAGMLKHLSEKTWWSGTFERALLEAERHVKRKASK